MQAIGGSRGGRTTKLRLITDLLGRPLSASLSLSVNLPTSENGYEPPKSVMLARDCFMAESGHPASMSTSSSLD